MGNTSGREGQAVPGAAEGSVGGRGGAEGQGGRGGGGHGIQQGGGNVHRQQLPQYSVPPSGHHHHYHQHHPNNIRDPARIGHVASADSMGHSPSDSPGSTARSPLMFTPQV